jgi:TetR/AcrR family transcriptional regulator
MPKETFKQLPFDKKERILKAAAGIFAETGFAGTDVAQIAARAGVAKGSLYNYFESKEDLYLYVCRDGIERSRAAVYHEILPEWDTFRQIEHIFRRGVSFVLAHPEYIRLYLNVSSAGMERFADRLTLEVEKHTADYLKDLLREGISRGTVRQDIDVNLTAFLINSLYVIFVVSLISNHFQIRMKEYLGIKGELNEHTIEGSLKAVLEMMGNVLGPTRVAKQNRMPRRIDLIPISQRPQRGKEI